LYLKKIEMRGFKSFAEQTKVEFKKGVTCVVGPNGSGKSNITDAVRWVLGEQRIKALRGTKMEDVIFNGTTHRKALGLAEVQLIFDNEDQFFPLEYQEIVIIRRVHRSGESEYLINDLPCRLKDIKDLFMDTGVGREGYSIIGQGRIDEILSSNKDDRRLLFEEAAGITKFKIRKLEAEKKLKSTSENLIRISDILYELSERLSPLKIESDKASRFIALRDTLKNIEFRYFKDKIENSELKLMAIIDSMDKKQSEQQSLYDKVEKLKLYYNQKDETLFEINKELRSLDATFYEMKNKQAQTTSEKDLINEKLLNVDQNIQRLCEELGMLEIERNQIDEVQNNLKDFIDEIGGSLVDKNNELGALNQLFNSMQKSVGDIQKTTDSEKQRVFNFLNNIEIKKSEIENLNRFIENFKKRLDESEKMKAEKTDTLNLLDNTRKDIGEKILEVESDMIHIQETIDKNIDLSDYQNKESQKIKIELEKNQSILTRSQTERTLLVKLEEEFDGYDKGVKDILVNLADQTGIHGIVATLIEVPKSCETAIEVALGRSVQNIVCDTDQEAKRCIDYLRNNNLGRVTFLPMQNLKPSQPQKNVLEKAMSMSGYIGLASDLIKTHDKYKSLMTYLLGRVLIVEDFDSAREFLKIDNIKYRIITLKGDILIPGGTITGGTFQSKISNILGRKRRIETLKTQIDSANVKLLSLQSDFKVSQSLINDTQILIDEQRRKKDQLKINQVQLNHRFNQQEHLKKDAEEALKKIMRDSEILNNEISAHDLEIERHKKYILEAEDTVKQLESNLSITHSEMALMQKDVESISEKMTHLKVDIGSDTQTKQYKERELNRTLDDLKTTENKIMLRKQQIEEESNKKNKFIDEIDRIQKESIKISNDTMRIQDDIVNQNTQKEKLTKDVKSSYDEITSLSQQIDITKEDVHKLEIQKTKLESEKEAIVSDLWERYEITIGEIIKMDLSKVEDVSKLKQIKNEIKELGAVNISAIDEFQEVSDRHAFLLLQKEDLESSMNQLTKIIQDLEKQMIKLFKDHFKIINQYFKETFNSLFSGGDAELLIADTDDILNCDIEIIAQPPGKKLQSIDLLSGGEKALTAIALLFAILKHKPTPFCILDEIEAALDDVNVYRFARFIKAYAKNSQFVVITHRKGTMEIADTLYGVTMEEYGISKILSVKLEDVEENYGV